MAGWYGPQGCAESCCEDDCSKCDHCTDEAISDPLSSYTSSCTVPSEDWIVDVFVDDWGDGDLEIVAGPVTATVKKLTDDFGSTFWRVDFPNTQNPLDEGCEGPLTYNDASGVGGMVIRIVYRTEEITRGIDCVSTELHESVTVSMLAGDPCTGSQSGSSVCQASKYTTTPTGTSIELTASGTGTVVSKIRVMNRVVDNIPCVETTKCSPCEVWPFDIAHWRDLSVTISGLPAGNSDPYGSSGTFLASYHESWSKNRQCAATEEDEDNFDFYCGDSYFKFTREVMGMGEMNGTYTPKLVDLLDETRSSISLSDVPDGVLDPAIALCRDQRYAWMMEIPVVPVVVVERIIEQICPGAVNETDKDETTVRVGYLRATLNVMWFSFYEVYRYVVEGASEYDTAISNGADITWDGSLITGDQAQKGFDTSFDSPFFETEPFHLGPWDSLSTTGTRHGSFVSPGIQVDDIPPTTFYMPVVSYEKDSSGGFKKFFNNLAKTLDLGRCDGEQAWIHPAVWSDVDFTRSYDGYEDYTPPGTCQGAPPNYVCEGVEGCNERLVINDAYSYTSTRTSGYDLDGGC